MGGTTEPIANALKESYAENASLTDALGIAVAALRAGSADTSGGDQPTLGVASLEVAVLDANRPRRAFRRITGSALQALLVDQESRSLTANRRAESESPTRVWDPAATLTAPNPGSTRRRPS